MGSLGGNIDTAEILISIKLKVFIFWFDLPVYKEFIIEL